MQKDLFESCPQSCLNSLRPAPCEFLAYKNRTPRCGKNRRQNSREIRGRFAVGFAVKSAVEFAVHFAAVLPLPVATPLDAPWHTRSGPANNCEHHYEMTSLSPLHDQNAWSRPNKPRRSPNAPTSPCPLPQQVPTSPVTNAIIKAPACSGSVLPGPEQTQQHPTQCPGSCMTHTLGQDFNWPIQ